MTLVSDLSSRKIMESSGASRRSMFSGEKGDSVGPGGARGTCWSSKCKEKNLEPQKNQGVTEDRGQRGEPDSGMNSLLIPIKSSGSFPNS